MVEVKQTFFLHLGIVISPRKTIRRKELLANLAEGRDWIWELPAATTRVQVENWAKWLSEFKLDMIPVHESLKFMLIEIPPLDHAENLRQALVEVITLIDPVEVLTESLRQKILGKVKDFHDRQLIWTVGDHLLKALTEFDSALSTLLSTMQVDREFSVHFQDWTSQCSWLEEALQVL